MNTKILMIALALTLPLTAGAFPGGGDGHGFRHSPENKLERLAEKLELSDEQKQQLQTIFKEQREKHEALREETDSRMKQVLTEDQMKQLETMKQSRHEKWQKWQEKRQGSSQ